MGPSLGSPERARNPLPRVPAYHGLLVSGLILAGLCAFFVYFRLMGQFFPDIRVVNLAGDVGRETTLRDLALAPGAPPREARVLYSRRNQGCAERAEFDAWSTTLGWESMARELGFRVQRIDAAAIPAGPREAELLIVPWSLCLDSSTGERIDRYLARGGGVVVSGPLDVAALESEAKISLLLTRWLGATRVRAMSGNWARWLMAAGRTAPGALLAPAQRLEIPVAPRGVALNARHPVLFWSGWGLQPLESGESGSWSAAALGQVGAGRVVWFGVPVTESLESSQSSLAGIRALALRWASGDPVLALAPWPAGHDHAVVVAVDSAGPGTVLGDPVEWLADQGLRPTLFVYGAELSDPDVRMALAAGAEIGSRGDRQAVLAREPRARQRRRLRESARDIERVVGRRVPGLHPPEERFDAITLSESVAVGHHYLIGDPEFDRAYPRWISVGGSSLALLSRAGAADDFAALRDRQPGKSPGSGSLAEGFLKDLNRLRRLGGLYLLTLRPDLLGAREWRPTLSRIAAAIHDGNPWIATASEVVSWTRARSLVRVERLDDGQVRVTNSGDEEIRQFVIEVFDGAIDPTHLMIPKLESGGGHSFDLSELRPRSRMTTRSRSARPR